jgi:hypothetical protein
MTSIYLITVLVVFSIGTPAYQLDPSCAQYSQMIYAATAEAQTFLLTAASTILTLQDPGGCNRTSCRGYSRESLKKIGI